MDSGAIFYVLAIGPAALLMFGLGFGVNALVGSIVAARRARKSANPRSDVVNLRRAGNTTKSR